jgi:hypothetical protein
METWVEKVLFLRTAVVHTRSSRITRNLDMLRLRFEHCKFGFRVIIVRARAEQVVPAVRQVVSGTKLLYTMLLYGVAPSCSRPRHTRMCGGDRRR